MDIVRGIFYYTESHNKSNPENTYKLTEFMSLKQDPELTEECDWKFAFSFEIKEIKFILHCKTQSIHKE